MQVVRTIAEMQAAHKPGLGFVPTMGALHAGHLSLVERAKSESAQVCVSIFVNPTQFGPNEDFSKYPRTVEADLKLLEGAADIVYLPELEEIYPNSNGKIDTTTIVSGKITANPKLANLLCGLNRPGHFDGVCTVVKKLFDIVKPARAYFGEKDFQQLTIIREMVERLKLPIEIIGCPIMREPDGLAMSSRNRYLSDSDRKLATELYKELSKLAVESSGEELSASRTKLTKLGFNVDYLEKHWGRIFVAAKLGTTRLIDNLEAA